MKGYFVEDYQDVATKTQYAGLYGYQTRIYRSDGAQAGMRFNPLLRYPKNLTFINTKRFNYNFVLDVNCHTSDASQAMYTTFGIAFPYSSASNLIYAALIVLYWHSANNSNPNQAIARWHCFPYGSTTDWTNIWGLSSSNYEESDTWSISGNQSELTLSFEICLKSDPDYFYISPEVTVNGNRTAFIFDPDMGNNSEWMLLKTSYLQYMCPFETVLNYGSGRACIGLREGPEVVV